jgi:hypothetical protein
MAHRGDAAPGGREGCAQTRLVGFADVRFGSFSTEMVKADFCTCPLCSESDRQPLKRNLSLGAKSGSYAYSNATFTFAQLEDIYSGRFRRRFRLSDPQHNRPGIQRDSNENRDIGNGHQIHSPIRVFY